MAIDLGSLVIAKGDADIPPIILAYGNHGIGKTSFAAGAPAPIFLQTENGLGQISGVGTLGVLSSYDDVMDGIQLIYDKPEIYENFRTVVLDSAGWLEPLIWEKVRDINKWTEEKFQDYGRGYKASMNYWKNVYDGLSLIRNDRGMGIIILTHRESKKVEPPDSDSFTSYMPKLHQLAMGKLNEYVDAIFFFNYRVSVVAENAKDPNSRKRGVGVDQRVVYTQERPAWIAKNRWGMPANLDLPSGNPQGMFWAVAQHIPYYQQLAKGIEEEKTETMENETANAAE